MSMTFLQGTNALVSNVSSPGTTTLAYGSNVTKGNLLIVAADLNVTGVNLSVSDTLNNTWNVIGTTPVLAGNHKSYGWWAIANASGANTVTYTMTNAGTTNVEKTVSEYSVSGVTPVVDGVGAGGSAAITSTTISTSTGAAGLDDLVVVYFTAGGDSVTTPTTGYNSRVLASGGFSILADKIASAGGIQSASTTCTSGDLLGWIQNFRQIKLLASCGVG
jgi:hypothetical protein